MVKTEGLVLRVVPYKDKQYMLYLWTRKNGPQSFSVYTSRSSQGMLSAGQLRPMQRLEIVSTGSASAQVHRVREMTVHPESIRDFQGEQIVAFSLLAEWLASVLVGGQNEEGYFDEFCTMLPLAMKTGHCLMGLAALLAGLSRHLGFAPGTENYKSGQVLHGLSGRWMDPSNGNQREDSWCMNPASSRLYRRLLEHAGEPDPSWTLEDQALVHRYLEDLCRYFQVHIQGFRIPRYLSLVLNP
ncbi:MAG: hypothetical protein FJ343_04530 [Sphingomonadales bacterium]|nr:hypothetical protein [Sphingomonadales bacterium]